MAVTDASAPVSKCNVSLEQYLAWLNSGCDPIVGCNEQLQSLAALALAGCKSCQYLLKLHAAILHVNG